MKGRKGGRDGGGREGREVRWSGKGREGEGEIRVGRERGKGWCRGRKERCRKDTRARRDRWRGQTGRGRREGGGRVVTQGRGMSHTFL